MPPPAATTTNCRPPASYVAGVAKPADKEKADRLGRAGQQVLDENRGALERLLVLLEPLLADKAPG